MTETCTAPPVDLVLTDSAGTEYHAYVDEYHGRMPEWAATSRGIAADVRYRRQFRVTFPRYSKYGAIREHIAAALLPWERLYTTGNDHWGGDDIAVTAELIFPSSTWCMECGHDVRPDRYHRTSPYAVSITPAATHRSHTVRNYGHQAAHELAARERAKGNKADVVIDGCG